MFFQVEGITKSYGGLLANNDVTLQIDKGDIVGLIGPNGAGKSTLFKIISGYVVPDRGLVTFNDKRITGSSPHKICHSGIACTFQDAKNFPKLTMFETILTGAYCRNKNTKKAQALAAEIIEYVGLEGYENHLTGKLNMFSRKKTELASALATKPELLLLDELFAGCTPTETVELLNLVKRINSDFGVTLFIIEHVLKVIMSACSRVVVLNYGEVIENDTPEKIVKSEKVISAYLGDEYDAAQYS